MKTLPRRRWLLVIAGMAIYMCLGTVYSWSVFRTPLEQKLGIGSAESGIPYLGFLVCFTVSMLLLGKLTDRMNPRAMIFAGGAMVGLGWILAGLAQSFTLVVVFNGILAGCGVGAVYGAPIKFISGMFHEKRGMAIGLLVGGFGLSPFITAPISKSLINSLGVSSAFIVLGIAFLVLIPLLGWSFNLPGDIRRKEYDRKTEEHGGSLYVLKQPGFIGVWICFLIASTAGLMTIGVSSQIGVEVFKIDADTTAVLLSVFALFNAVGRPAFGWMTDRFSPLAASSASLSLIVIASALLYFSPGRTMAVYIAALSMLWLNLGAWMAIAPATVARFFGKRNYSRNYGVVFTAYGLGALIGTPLAELMKNVYGSYRFIGLPVMIAAAAGIVIAVFTLGEKGRADRRTA